MSLKSEWEISWSQEPGGSFGSPYGCSILWTWAVICCLPWYAVIRSCSRNLVRLDPSILIQSPSIPGGALTTCYITATLTQPSIQRSGESWYTSSSVESNGVFQTQALPILSGLASLMKKSILSFWTLIKQHLCENSDTSNPEKIDWIRIFEFCITQQCCKHIYSNEN